MWTRTLKGTDEQGEKWDLWRITSAEGKRQFRATYRFQGIAQEPAASGGYCSALKAIEAAGISRASYQAAQRKSRNQQRRIFNSMLRDMCGTSARAAREDMGLGSRYGG